MIDDPHKVLVLKIKYLFIYSISKNLILLCCATCFFNSAIVAFAEIFNYKKKIQNNNNNK